jgi:polar amino acid transport system substrate-binding protein
MRRWLCWLGLICLAVWPARAEGPLRVGWYAAAPFQWDGPRGVTGLDIEMVRALAAHAGQPLNFTRTAWPDLMRDIASGESDLASGVAWTPGRASAGQMTRAYRHDINVLITRRGEAGALAFRDGPGLLAHLRASRFRLGVIEGFSYGDAALDAWIAEGVRVRRSSDDASNLRLLLEGELDGFLAERIAAATLIAASLEPRAVEEQGLRIPIPLHLMFSPRVPAATVAAFDAAIVALSAEGTLARIAARFRAPVLLGLTLNSAWFLVLEVIGTIAAALAGYLAARHGRYSLFGALILALVTATGGGVLRDLLVDRHPIGVMSSPLYLQLILGTVVAACLVGWLSRRLPAFGALTDARSPLRERLFDFADALGLAAFAVVGVAVAVGTNATPLWLWGPLLGALTGAGGGILRDIIRGGGDVPNLKTGFYGEVALLWSIVLSTWLEWRAAVIEREEVLIAVVVTVAGAVITRMALLRMRAPGLP